MPRADHSLSLSARVTAIWVSGAAGVWEVSPHNGFIQIAVRIGLAGGLLLFGTYAAVIIRLGHAKDATSRIVRILTIGVLLFSSRITKAFSLAYF